MRYLRKMILDLTFYLNLYNLATEMKKINTTYNNSTINWQWWWSVSMLS